MRTNWFDDAQANCFCTSSCFCVLPNIHAVLGLAAGADPFSAFTIEQREAIAAGREDVERATKRIRIPLTAEANRCAVCDPAACDHHAAIEDVHCTAICVSSS